MIKAIKKELKVLCECDLPLPQMMKSIRRRRAEKALSGDNAIVIGVACMLFPGSGLSGLRFYAVLI